MSNVTDPRPNGQATYQEDVLIFPSLEEAEAYIADLERRGVEILHASCDGQGLAPPDVNLYIRARWPAR